MKTTEDFVTFDEGFGHLADLLAGGKDSLEVTTFDNFVQDVFSQSYPDYNFNTWHIRKISAWVDEMLASKNRLGMVALPRYHLKSTIIGYCLAIYRFLTSFGDGLYVSYKEELATFHLSNMKQAIERNPILNPLFKDMKSQSDSIINYRIGDRKIVRMFSSGVFSMKRGLHTDNCVVPETSIKCLEGFKPIDSVSVGTYVYTHRMKCKQVSKIMKREIKEQLVVLHLDNGEIIRITSNHPILTLKGWKKAGELSLEQVLIKPQRYSKRWEQLKKNHPSIINNEYGTHILKIDKEYYDGSVYNLEVEEDHSYVGKGIIYHNCVIVDDVLGTVDNPMVLTDLVKAERMFNQEIMNIPNPGCPLIVFGTAIDYSDLLFKLKDNPEFMHLWMPAIDPDEEHKVLWESRFNKEWLDTRKKSAGWKSFSSEFLLMPVLSADAFFTKADLDKVIDSSLKNISIYQTFNKEDRHVVAGLDIGKRRNPSHLSVFVDDKNENLIMIHQSFWDGLEYLEQIERIKTVVENFGVDKLYIDATRSEMEERGLPRQCIMIKFTGKGERNQASYANDFAARVENKKLRLLDDDRFISQILCLTNDLRAPVTSFGHADSFWSVALALGAYQDYYSSARKQRFSYMGNLQEQFIDHAPAAVKNLDGLCKVCNKRMLSQLPEGGWRCGNCQATFGSI